MIHANALRKKFGRHEALCGLSFTVREGNAYALIGANGAGKTTTIKLLVNILEPTRGSANVLGVDSRKISVRELRRIGYVSENQDMPERLTVAEYLGYLRPFYPKWDRSLEVSILRQLRLPGGRRIGDLSHGMRMKMALACALPFRPELLILDEPFSGLDPLVRDEFMEQLLRQAGEMTVLISSHELAEIDGVATHVAFLDEGKLLFEESMSDLTGRFREVRITTENEARPPGAAPAHWLDVRAMGNMLMFVDTRFTDSDLGERVHALVSGVRRIDAQPMALRRSSRLWPARRVMEVTHDLAHLQERREAVVVVGRWGCRAECRKGSDTPEAGTVPAERPALFAHAVSFIGRLAGSRVCHCGRSPSGRDPRRPPGLAGAPDPAKGPAVREISIRGSDGADAGAGFGPVRSCGGWIFVGRGACVGCIAIAFPSVAGEYSILGVRLSHEKSS